MDWQERSRGSRVMNRMERIVGLADDLGMVVMPGYFDYRMSGEGNEAGYQSVPVNGNISGGRKRGFFELPSEITGAK